MTMESSSSLADASHLVGVPELSKSMTRINFIPSPSSIVHKRILQTEARIQGQENNGVIPAVQYSKPKSPVVSLGIKGKEEQRQQRPTEEPSVEPKKSQRLHPQSHRRHSDGMHHGVPKMIDVKKEKDQEGEKTGTSHLDLLKDKKLKATRPKDHAVTKSHESPEESVSSSRERLERLGTLLTKARGNCHTAQTQISSLVDDAHLAESKTTEEVESLLQENEVEKHHHPYAGTRTIGFDKEQTLNEISRLKARLQFVKSEKANRAVASMSHSVNPQATNKWLVNPPPQPPTTTTSSPGQQARNRLVSKETHYIKTEYQESESKTDENGVKVESRLLSHVRMAVQQNEIGASDPRLDDPIFRLVFLAKELADQAAKIDFMDEYFPRMNPVIPNLPSSLPHPMLLNNRDSFPSMDPSMEKLYGPLPALTDGTASTLPPLQYLLNKLQDAEQQCLELQKTKDGLEASLVEANNYRRDLEFTVHALTDELEGARATNTSLSDELASAKEEIVILNDGHKKLEGELERTQNRLGDVTVQVSDLELEGDSLRQMVDEKDKEIDESMVLLKDQHKSVVGVLDNTREIRRLTTDLQEKLHPTSKEDAEDENDPALAQEAWEDWLKVALPQMDAMETALTTCRSQLAVKVQPPDGEAHEDEESSDAAKGRWSLFRFRR